MNSDSDKNYEDNETSMKGIGEDKREEIGKVGGVQIREISPIRPRGWGSSTEVLIVISTKDFKQGSNILDKSCS